MHTKTSDSFPEGAEPQYRDLWYRAIAVLERNQARTREDRKKREAVRAAVSEEQDLNEKLA